MLLLLVVDEKKKKEQKDQKKKRNHCTLWPHFQFVQALCKISETESYVQRFESCHSFYEFTLRAPIIKSALLTYNTPDKEVQQRTILRRVKSKL